MTEVTCPVCGEQIEEFDRVDVASIRLEPCGHQIDEEIYQDLADEMSRS